MKFDPNADFKTNINAALDELDDAEFAEILRQRMIDIINLANSSSAATRAPIIEEFQSLVKRRI